MRYYFDVEDDFYSAVDTEGTDFRSEEAACNEAHRLAAGIALDLLNAGGSRLTIKVRDDSKVLLQVALTLSVKACGPPTS
jgi:hypothetical protein